MHPEKANMAMKPDKDQAMERKVVFESNGKKNAVHEMQKAKNLPRQLQDKKGPSKWTTRLPIDLMHECGNNCVNYDASNDIENVKKQTKKSLEQYAAPIGVARKEVIKISNQRKGRK